MPERETMLKTAIACTIVALALVAPTAAHARVNVDIGINLPGPPALVAVPGTVVTYAPDAPVNYFSYGGQFYVFRSGAWYVSSAYNGPWVVVAPAYVPRPLLAVPVRYYHTRPAEWRGWQADAAPHWQHDWGHRWVEHDDHGEEHHKHHGHDEHHDHDDHARR